MNTKLHENVFADLSATQEKFNLFWQQFSKVCVLFFLITKTLWDEQNQVEIRNFVPARQRDTSACSSIPSAGRGVDL